MAVLFAIVKANNRRTEKRLDECDEDREAFIQLLQQMATANLTKDRPLMQRIEDVATARVEKKRLKPPSDPPQIEESVP